MRALAPLLALGLAACDLSAPCPTIVYAAGTMHSVAVAVADSLEREGTAGQNGAVCYRLMALDSYELIDQPDAEVALAERIVADPTVVAVVGHMRSRGSLAAVPVYARAGVPQIVPGATSHLLRSAGPWTFVLAPTDSDQAVFLAAQADSLHVRRVIVMYSGEPYGEGLHDVIAPELARRGIGVVETVRLGVGTDVTTLAEAAIRPHPADGIILLVDYSQAARIARTAVAIRPSLRLLAADGAMYPAGVRQIAGAAAESLAIVSLWDPDTADPVTRRYMARFRQVAGRDPTPSEALGADGLMYARAAVLAVGPDRSAIRVWLAGAGGAVPPEGGVTGHTLHGRRSPRFMLVRIGPPVKAP